MGTPRLVGYPPLIRRKLVSADSGGAGVSSAPHEARSRLRALIRRPGIELATLEDAARFIGHMKPWRQARPHWDFAAELLLKAAETGKRRDVEAATSQMERALRVEGHGAIT